MLRAPPTKSARLLFRCNDIAPDGFLDRNEDVVALLVDTLGKVALYAHALSDIELPGALTEKDSRRLPRLGENLRREYLELVVQDVFVGKIDALDHPHVAIIGHTGSLADGKGHLRKNVNGVDDEGVAFPMAGRMAMEGWVRHVGMRTAVGVDAAQPVAVGFAQH